MKFRVLCLTLVICFIGISLVQASEVSSVDAARSLGNAFVEVAKQEKPAVVSITIERTLEGATFFRGFDSDFFKGTPFEDFFRDFDTPQQKKEYKPKTRGSGSGVIIDDRGYILTNNHVVGQADKITVKLSDAREFDAEVIGTDPKTDLALIKIDAKELPVAKLGDSDMLEVGEWVIAIGNPFGLEHTVTVGVVSAKGRTGLGAATYEDFIQTDASINPGNSGGPLVDINGEVVGINTMIIGMGTGIGFAIPINMAKNIIDDLIEHGKVTRPWFGVGIQDLTPELRKHFEISEENGVIVNQIYEDSPAKKAGLKIGDIIVEVDGKEVDNAQSLVKEVLKKPIGKNVKLGVIRDGDSKEIKIKTKEMPSSISGVEEYPGKSKEKAKPLFGLVVKELTEELAKKIGIDHTEAVVVVNIEPQSPAHMAGIRAGDIVVAINHKKIKNLKEYNSVISKNDIKKGVLLLIKRQDQTFFVQIQGDY